MASYTIDAIYYQCVYIYTYIHVELVVKCSKAVHVYANVSKEMCVYTYLQYIYIYITEGSCKVLIFLHYLNKVTRYWDFSNVGLCVVHVHYYYYSNPTWMLEKGEEVEEEEKALSPQKGTYCSDHRGDLLFGLFAFLGKGRWETHDNSTPQSWTIPSPWATVELSTPKWLSYLFSFHYSHLSFLP